MTGKREPAGARSPGGYQGRPILKAPVWTWEIPLYFTLGGAGGMAAVVALFAALAGAATEAQLGLRVAALGALASPPLLVSDLGRPRRFLNMLRIVKLGSPMSVGAWTLAAFGVTVVPAWLWSELAAAGRLAVPPPVLLLVPSAGLGLILAIYTGVLLVVTVIPAWNRHATLLPGHAAVAGLGTASALVELGGGQHAALAAIGVATSLTECAFLAVLMAEASQSVPIRRVPAVRTWLASPIGRATLILAGSGSLMGPVALATRLAGAPLVAAATFALGALVGRYGWLALGRASARLT